MERSLIIDEYNNHILVHIRKTIEYFPLIKVYSIIPLYDYPLFTLSGIAIPETYFKRYALNYDDISFNTDKMLKVFVEVPLNYLDVGCKVYDSSKVIDWDKIPHQHRHYNGSSHYGNELCTHLPEESRDMENPILENIKTAYSLFLESENYLSTGNWRLKEYSHGDKGKKEYEKTRMLRKTLNRWRVD